MKKFGKVLKKGIKNIINWVKENPAVQPLMVILVIFAVIFSLTRIGPMYNTVSGWFNNSKTREPIEVSYEEVNNLIGKEGEDFILFYGSETCSYCIEYKETTLHNYLGIKNRLNVYYFDVDNAIEEDKISEIDLILQRERLFNISGLDFTNNYDYEDPGTPITFYFRNGYTYRIYVGLIDLNTFKDLINPDVKFVDPATMS